MRLLWDLERIRKGCVISIYELQNVSPYCSIKQVNKILGIRNSEIWHEQDNNLRFGLVGQSRVREFIDFLFIFYLFWLAFLINIFTGSWSWNSHGLQIFFNEFVQNYVCWTFELLFLTSIVMDAVRGQKCYSKHTLWHSNSIFASTHHIWNSKNKTNGLDFL